MIGNMNRMRWRTTPMKIRKGILTFLVFIWRDQIIHLVLRHGLSGHTRGKLGGDVTIIER